MKEDPGRETKAKRLILAGLSHALANLSERMRSQGTAATKITLLAVRAEKIAQRSWDLNSSQNRHFQRDSEALIAEVKAFAREATSAAKLAGEEALLGREVANAIAAHSQDIAQLARDIDVLPDASAVRARLRPLSVTLSTLPERLKANAATIKDVNNIATLAEGLAERGDKIASGGTAGSQEAVALCRDLRRFAAEATAVSLEMTRGSALAVQAINDLAERTTSLSRGQPVAEAPVTADDRMAALVSSKRAAKEVWVSSASRPATQKPVVAGIVWGSKA